MKELPVPPAVESAENAIELARIWAAGGSQHITIETGVWEDPGASGMMLVDFARHVADAYEQSGTTPRSDALARIKEVFDAEWSHPTDTPTGRLLA